MAIIRDDRTDEQRARLQWAIVGTDPFLSGWGRATGGQSYAAWATDEGNVNRVYAEIANRSDMQRVRIVYLPTYRPGRACADLHIYTRDYHD